jgi:hypothetical protein
MLLSFQRTVIEDEEEEDAVTNVGARGLASAVRGVMARAPLIASNVTTHRNNIRFS